MITLGVSQVRPLLNYYSSVWSVGYVGELNLLESVQRRRTSSSGYILCWKKDNTSRSHDYIENLRYWCCPVIFVWDTVSLCHPWSWAKSLMTKMRHRFFKVRRMRQGINITSSIVFAGTFESFKNSLDCHMMNILFHSSAVWIVAFRHFLVAIQLI